MESQKNGLFTKAIWYLIIATITIMLINFFSIARYSSNTGSNMNLSIAKPVIILDSPTTEVTNLDKEYQEIGFSVKNFNENENSDIAFYYQLKFENSGNIPVNYTLYKINDENRVRCELSENNISQNFYMPHSENSIDYFVVCVKMENVDYQGQLTQMRIKLDASQVI